MPKHPTSGAAPKSKSKKLSTKPHHRRTVAVQVYSGPQPEPVRPTVVKLGSSVTDGPTGLKGMVTHMHVEMNGAIFYNFQPTGLNPQNGEPLKPIWAAQDRIQGGERIPLPAMPLRALGTRAEDMASGFNGTIVSMTLHISGCVHVSIQPNRPHPKTGGHIAAHDFDIRRVKGDAIPVLTDQEREKDQAEKPSPIEVNASLINTETSSPSSGPFMS